MGDEAVARPSTLHCHWCRHAPSGRVPEGVGVLLGNGPQLLVVADCHAVDEMVADLARFGFSSSPASTGAEVVHRLHEADVVLVDIDLEDFDGLTLCRQIRAGSDIPLIGFTSSSELDRVLALEAGCDDCVDKPYRGRELAARIQALLRRARVLSAPTLSAGTLTVQPTLREVRIADAPVEMTRKEFELLQLLISERDRVFTRAELMRRVWEYDGDDSELTSLASRTIDTHVSSLRKKLGSPDWIVTVRGVGFRFNDASAAADGADVDVLAPGA